MFAIDYTPLALGRTKFEVADNYSVTQIKKGFNEADNKHFTLPLTANNEQEYLDFIDKKFQEGCTLLPSFILPEYEEAVRQRYHIFEDSNKSVRVYENKGELTNTADTDNHKIDILVKEFYDKLAKKYSFTKLSTIPFMAYIRRIIKEYEQYKYIVVENEFCIFLQIGDYTFIYVNTIPNVRKFFNTKYIVFGLEYKDFVNDTVLLDSNKHTLQLKPLITIFPKSKGLLGKQKDRLLEKLIPLTDDVFTELLSKDYSRIIRSIKQDATMSAIADLKEPEHLIVTYQDQNNIILYDIPQNKITQGWTLDNSPENIEYFKNICRILTGKDVKIRKLVSDYRIKGTVWFENDKSSLNISGKKYLSLRNQLNKIDKMIKSGELVIKEYENEIPVSILKDTHKIVEQWQKEWNSRHTGESNTTDGIKLSIDYTYFLANLLTIYRGTSLKPYLIIAYHNDKPIGYLSDVQSTGIYVYNADAITLNKNTIRGLRQYFNIKSIEYWTKKLGNDVVISTGYTGLNGLKELKYQLRPVRMYM